jgi:alpha-beta hydrolase superfamily lysophospholipase
MVGLEVPRSDSRHGANSSAAKDHAHRAVTVCHGFAESIAKCALVASFARASGLRHGDLVASKLRPAGREERKSGV